MYSKMLRQDSSRVIFPKVGLKNSSWVVMIQIYNNRKSTICQIISYGAVPFRIPVYEEGILIGFEKGKDGDDYLTGIDEETLRFIADRSNGIYVREDDIYKAINFIEENLALKKIETKGEFNPIVSYLLLASLISLGILKRYSTI